MKKFLSVLMILVLCFCATAFAEDINWADIEESASELISQGEFVTFDDIAVKLWIPTIMPAVELTEADTENGYIGYFMTEDQAAAIAVVYIDVDGMSLSDYAAYLAENGVTGIEEGTINGLSALTYTFDSEGVSTLSIAFATELGCILEISMAPMSDEGFASLATIVASSIQPAEA